MNSPSPNLIESPLHVQRVATLLSKNTMRNSYKIINKFSKRVVLDVVNTMTLVDISRSTTKIKISLHTFSMLEDVIAEIDNLN